MIDERRRERRRRTAGRRRARGRARRAATRSGWRVGGVASTSRTVSAGRSASAVPGADDDRLRVGAELVRVGARRGATVIHCDVPSARRDAAVEAHRGLGDDERRGRCAGDAGTARATRSRRRRPTPTSTSMPASRSRANPGARDLRVGILERDDDPARRPRRSSASAHGGVRPWCAQGSSVTYAVAPRARSPAARSASTSACAPPGGCGRALADDLAVADEDAADPRVRRGAATSARRRAAAPGPSPRRRARSSSPFGRPAGRGDDGRPRRHARDAARPPRSASRPSPIRTLTVGPGISPGRRPTGGRAFAGFRGRSPVGLVVTAGRDFHPTPRAVFSCVGCDVRASGAATGSYATRVSPTIQICNVFLICDGAPEPDWRDVRAGVRLAGQREDDDRARRSPKRSTLPLLARDTIKESLWDALGPGDLAWSRRLGGASAEAFWRLADRDAAAAVLDNFFHRAFAHRLEALPGAIVEVHCACPPDLALERVPVAAAAPVPLRPVVRRRHVRPVEPHRLRTARRSAARSSRSTPRKPSTSTRSRAWVRATVVPTARLVGVAAGEEVERVGDDREDHLEALERAARRAGQVADQRLAPRARTPRATACRSRGRPSSLARRIASAMPGRLALDDRARALGREVARAEAGAAGRDDSPAKPSVSSRSAAATASMPSATTRWSTTS